MTELLPIKINVSDSLVVKLDSLPRIIHRIEAHLNFQSMAANWYEDEENIISIVFALQSVEEFNKPHKDKLNDESGLNFRKYADDVRSYQRNDKKVFNIDIAITAKELSLLIQHKSLVHKICEVKIRKVINLIAIDLSLPALP